MNTRDIQSTMKYTQILSLNNPNSRRLSFFLLFSHHLQNTNECTNKSDKRKLRILLYSMIKKDNIGAKRVQSKRLCCLCNGKICFG